MKDKLKALRERLKPMKVHLPIEPDDAPESPITYSSESVKVCNKTGKSGKDYFKQLRKRLRG